MTDRRENTDDTPTSLAHGGNLSEAARAFGTPADGWLDLSTGINPIPYPAAATDPARWQRLPLADDNAALLHAARHYYGLSDDAAITAAPGTQAIIQWLPRLYRQGTVDIVSPTYNEHAHCWSGAGHLVRPIASPADADADIIVIVNPNNPDGRTETAPALSSVAEAQAAKGGLLIVDEAFADVGPDNTVAGFCGTPGLLVLRSFGKFFGLAGLRLGFAVGTDADIDKLKTAIGPWAVAGPALEIGARALKDTGWHAKTRARLSDDTRRLDALLTRAGLRLVGGTDLFRLAACDDAAALYDRLAGQGILVRIFEEQPTWVRFGLPGREEHWQRLERAFADL